MIGLHGPFPLMLRSGRAEPDAEGGGAEAAGEDPCDGGGDVPPAAALERRPLASPAGAAQVHRCSRAHCTLGLQAVLGCLQRRLDGLLL